jgi:hypothetical protein
MALSDLQVYSETAYASMTEVLQQQVELFNAATGGAITLASAAMQGDFSETAFFKKISGLVRRRNAYGSGAVAAKSLQHLVDAMVKVAAGTPPVRIDPGQFRWIQQNPEVAGAALGQQLAVDTMADMLNTALGAGVAGIGNNAAMVLDRTAETDASLSWLVMNLAQAKFGDASSRIVAWVMHSTPLFQLYANNLTNAQQLFNFGNVNVSRDPWGRLLIATDSPALFVDATTDYYNTLGLVEGALAVQMNNDFDATEETNTGDENIIRKYQAEWSYNLGLRGYSWDKTNGGKSPNDAALFTGTNWDKWATDNKDTAGVLIKTE